MDLQNIYYLLMKSYTDPELLRRVRASVEEDGISTGVVWLENAAADSASSGHLRKEKNTLWITDSAAGLSLLRGLRYPCAAWRTDWNAGEDLSAAGYILTDLPQIDLDDFVKIFQRETGQPWTILRTRRLLIREFTDTPEDLRALYRLYDDPEAERFLEPLLPDRTREQKMLRSYIRNVYGFYGFGSWAVVRADSQTSESDAFCSDGEVIGRMGFGIPDAGDRDFVPSFGYLIRADCRHLGYAREAAEAILGYGFHTLGFTSVRAETSPDNAASIALLNHLGFFQTQETPRSISCISADAPGTSSRDLFLSTAQSRRAGLSSDGLLTFQKKLNSV